MFLETDPRTRLKKIAYPNINLPVKPGLKHLAIVKKIGRDDETTIKILESMKQFPCLWNPSLAEYQDKERRIAALQIVADETNCEEELLMERIDEVRTNFIQQLAALEENPNDPVQINWFQKAQFLWAGLTDEEISESTSFLPMKKKKPRLEDKIEIKQRQASYPKRCRICLDVQKPNEKSLVELKFGDGLVEMFKKLTSYRVLFDQGAHLPRHICETCQSSMLASQKFMDRCNRTENILQTVYQCFENRSAHQLLTDLKSNDVDVKMEVVELQSEEEETIKELPVDDKWINESNKSKPTRQSQRKSKPTLKAKQSKPKTVKQPVLKTKEEPKAKPQRITTQPKSEGIHRVCPFCGLLPRKGQSNQDHIKKCALNPDRVQDYYECEHCPLRYTAKKFLLNHLRSKHFNIIIEHKCKFCDKVYASTSAVYNHIRRNHLKQKPHVCTVCDKSFAFKVRLDEHIRSMHTKETPFSCHLCDAQRSSRKQLKLHLDRVHSTQMVYCDVCGKAFKHQRYLKTHSAIHTGEKPYKCPCCVMRFSESRPMRNHCERHHPDYVLPPKGTVVKEDYLPVLKSIQERQESLIKF